ncbi:MAG TPA: CHAT domain-containing protein, partial [Gaiellaceae bacterium]|nr:CHAT domain-containing protein [Gaiellaceae bacterium]
LDGAGIAHLAAHGSFRADNPLFSSLELADGPLTVYDLESLAEAPSLCVLSACDSGLSEVRAGDELMGLTATLLALGSSTIVASVVAVPDEASTALMSAFHGRLATGTPPAEALVHAQAAVADGDEGVVASAGFVCFGAG